MTVPESLQSIWIGVLGDAICLFSADERPLARLREQLVAPSANPTRGLKPSKVFT